MAPDPALLVPPYRQMRFMITRASFSGSWWDDTNGETTSARM